MSTFERFQADVSGWTDPEASQPRDDGAAAPSDCLACVRREIDELEQGQKPYGLTDERWFTLLRDLRNFTEQWLDLALGCGWALNELYGAPSELHHRRLDQSGVVVLLDGRPVVSIDANRIVISNGRHPAHVFYRQSPGVSVPFERGGGDLVWNTLRRSRVRRVEW
jgi:hypothetical protein